MTVSINMQEVVPIQGVGAAQLSATVEGGSLDEAYNQIPVSEVTDLTDYLQQILGTTSVAVVAGDPRMRRTPPLASPKVPWWVANRVSGFKGETTYTTVPAATPLEVPLEDSITALYYDYRMSVNYGPRPYSICTDSLVNISTADWTDAVSNGDGTFTAINYPSVTICDEWKRYTDWTKIPTFQFLTGRLGSMSFADTSSANGKIYDGAIQLYLPDFELAFNWYQVPFRYITSPNSFLNQWVGRINQTAWYFGLFPPGSLLYKGYTYKIYTPPVPGLSPFIATTFTSSPKLVDIQLRFAYTTRTSTFAPSPSNANFIAAGWNLMPWWGDLGFHYCTIGKSGGNGRPQYLSFVPDFLFGDPDA